MLRYLLIATVLVVGTAVLATAWANRTALRIRIASVDVPAPPKAVDTDAPGRDSVPFSGDAPWALSALPGCVTQLSETTGPRAYVLAHLPADATPVVPPATLAYGTCTISLIGDEAYVRRGNDRLHIPPHVRFYRAPGSFAVLRSSAGGNELRVYQPVPQKQQ